MIALKLFRTNFLNPNANLDNLAVDIKVNSYI